MSWLFSLFAKPEQYSSIEPLPPFDEQVINFLNDFSSLLIKNMEVRAYPDVATFAFFCRKSNIAQLKKRHLPPGNRMGRGTAFHIAPSNVPVNFAYSLICGLLAGNDNIVRVPSKSFRQVDLIIKALQQIAEMPQHNAVARRIHLIRYERGSSLTDFFSSHANVRIIWGGDQTIQTIRLSPLPARSFDITFADRYSVCAINAEKLIQQDSLGKIAEGFYNDTYLFDQNACSAPHLIMWVGSELKIEEAQNKFWTALQQIVDKKYELQSILAIDKLNALYRRAISTDNIIKINTPSNSLWRVKLEKLTDDIPIHKCMGGYFYEFATTNLNDLASIVTTKYQTLSYFGFSNDELLEFITNNSLKGIDRIVPIGKTTDFSLAWDGYDLMNMLTREITII